MAIETVGPPPKTEKGVATAGVGLWDWSALVEDREYVPLLQFPNSVLTYEKMFTDAQLKGLYAGTVLPLRRFRYRLNPNGASSAVVNKLSKDYGIPVKGKEAEFSQGRRRGRFSWAQHLELLLRHFIFGFYFFEQVGEIDPEKYGDAFWHIKKLAPRPPHTISEVMVEKDGGLKGIKQNTAVTAQLNAPDIPVTQLIAYVLEQEGGNWYGTSLFRACYRNWMIKDRLLRVDAIKHERNGVGMPIIEAPPDADEPEMDRLNTLAQQFKAHERGGAAVPSGTKVTLQGTQGNLPDTVASINMHNEEMARAFLMMFMNLSQGSSGQGSYALGSGFMDFFAYSQESYADRICTTFTEHMLEDDVDWNFGPDEACPQLEWTRAENEEIPTADLATLVEKKIITVDPELEALIRQRYSLPAAPEPEEAPEPPEEEPQEEEEETQPEQPSAGAKASAGGRRRKRGVRAADTPLPLPPRELRRQPYDHEVLAQVDYAQLESIVKQGTQDAVAEFTTLQQQQIQQLHDAIVAADGDLVKLSQIKADPVAQDLIFKHLRATAEKGMETALNEAQLQGKPVGDLVFPDIEDLETHLTNRAKAVDQVLSASISEAASRQAINRTGGELSAAEVADQVQAHLEGLSDAYLNDQLGGTMSQGMNTGRRAVMRVNDPEAIYASELLDTNTCTNCTAKDGTEYLTLGDAEKDYPTGGYTECEGGPRCRGTLVAIYPEAAPTLEEPAEA